MFEVEEPLCLDSPHNLLRHFQLVRLRYSRPHISPSKSETITGSSMSTICWQDSSVIARRLHPSFKSWVRAKGSARWLENLLPCELGDIFVGREETEAPEALNNEIPAHYEEHRDAYEGPRLFCDAIEHIRDLERQVNRQESKAGMLDLFMKKWMRERSARARATQT
jgi:hypothetical protein